MLALLCLLLAAAPTDPVFPEIEGLKLTGAPAKYDPESLYEYINGGADAFLSYDFEELSAATYVAADKSEISVDVYRHRDAVRAFGMYLQERPDRSKPLAVGIEGYAGDQHLEFVAGAYYVKLSGKDERLLAVAQAVAAKLPGTREPPAVFKAFPVAGRIPRAEKLSTRDFLGHAFLRDGFAVPYEIEGARFRLFAIQARDTADAQQVLARYFAAGKVTEKPKAEGTRTLADPLNGEVLLAWRGRWLLGAVDQGAAKRKALVEELGKALPR
jgi:hypothetical protein